MNRIKHFFLFIMLLFGIFLLNIKKTSADLTAQRSVLKNTFSASTLSFSLQNSANFSSVSTLFNTPGFMPGGFDVKAIRITQTGKTPFKYRIHTELPEDHGQLCSDLTLQVLKNWTETYKGPLAQFSSSADIAENGTDNWVFVLSLPENQNTLKDQTCSFNITANTWKHDPNEELKGLWAKKTLANVVTSGRW